MIVILQKVYGKKFEDLDRVIDGSSPTKEVKSGYHICEAVVLGKNEKQPISLYSKVYSTKSTCFISMNNYKIESINTCSKVIGGKFTGVFDREDDDNKIIDYMDKLKNNFVIRMNDKRIFLLKGKKKNAYAEALKRKEKIRMELWFDDNEKKKCTYPIPKLYYLLIRKNMNWLYIMDYLKKDL